MLGDSSEREEGDSKAFEVIIKNSTGWPKGRDPTAQCSQVETRDTHL